MSSSTEVKFLSELIGKRIVLFSEVYAIKGCVDVTVIGFLGDFMKIEIPNNKNQCFIRMDKIQSFEVIE